MARDPQDSIVGMDLRSWPRPLPTSLPEASRGPFVARCEALQAVAGGMSLRAAAAAHGVDARTLSSDVVKATQTHADGQPIGFRSCIPFRHRLPRTAKVPTAAPTRGGAYSFTRLLAAFPALKALVLEFRGSLPTGKAKARSFDRHFRTFRAKAQSLLPAGSYPLGDPDGGRRALLNHHRSLRKQRRDVGAAVFDSTPPTTKRFNQLFTLAPLDRCEFDAHTEDVNWVTEIRHPNGDVVQRRISKVTLLAMVCAVSRYLVAYLLVLGEYNQQHVLQLFRNALKPWVPRELIVPGMAYAHGAVLGLPVDESGAGPRPVVCAGDNAKAHLSRLSVSNFTDYFHGVLNFGKAHVPEGRPIIEAFFRRLEQGALRSIAGGFHPKSHAVPAKTFTSYLRSSDHPLHWVGVQDLMDVIASGYNVTPHSGIADRLPRDVLNAHLASGWFWKASDAVADAQKIGTIRTNVTLRGSKDRGKHPYVQYQGAIYRSQRLMGQWDRVGRSFAAEVSLEDLRYLVLLDPTDGTPWSRLTALPPWHASPHDFDLRQRIVSARQRGLLEIAGSEDAIKAYHAFTRSEALKAGSIADDFVRSKSHQSTDAAASKLSVLKPARPRAGGTSFAHRKD